MHKSIDIAQSMSEKQQATLLVQELYSSFELCKRRCGEIKDKCNRTQARVTLIMAQQEMNMAVEDFRSKAERIKKESLVLMKTHQGTEDEQQAQELLKKIGGMK